MATHDWTMGNPIVITGASPGAGDHTITEDFKYISKIRWVGFSLCGAPIPNTIPQLIINDAEDNVIVTAKGKAILKLGNTDTEEIDFTKRPHPAYGIVVAEFGSGTLYIYTTDRLRELYTHG